MYVDLFMQIWLAWFLFKSFAGPFDRHDHSFQVSPNFPTFTAKQMLSLCRLILLADFEEVE